MAGSEYKETRTAKAETPLMRQYYKIKQRHPNALLLFRLGDFYETFEEDARIVSRTLGITLTRRANGKAHEVPLAGFPYHALDNYLPRLVNAGYRVAVCEQLEDPKYARKIVKRDVVEVVTPGVTFHDQLLTPKHSNYLAAVHWDTASNASVVGFAFIDASTGEFGVSELPSDRLDEILQAFAPREVLVDKRHQDRLATRVRPDFLITPLEDWCFSFEFAYEALLRHFKTHSLKGFGVDELRAGIVAAGAALHYLADMQKGRLAHVSRLVPYSPQDYISLDRETKRNLELISSMQGAGQEGSLISILDETRTPMGARLLRKWLLRPLKQIDAIESRLDAVDELVRRSSLRDTLRIELKEVGDLERLAAKISMGRANPRDVVQVRRTLSQIPAAREALSSASASLLHDLGEGLALLPEVVQKIEAAIVDDPPANLADGGLIRSGYNGELDELRGIARNGKDWVGRLQKKESERTGIPSLKIGYNRVFGYYIEITNAHKGRVPDGYTRKQTLVNAERYVTPELKEYEEKILSAEERMTALEQQLFNDLRATLAEETPKMLENAALLAAADSLCSMAEVAVQYNYTRPSVHEGGELLIEDGRHPVVERMLPPGEPFIPNSVRLDPQSEQILIITGPNMAGKSVILRQTGLIVLLAQTGSFVPAARAHIGLVDRIFTRVGASDNLAAGESTFLVEMNETANILNNATPRSLILLDEVGRGTSTFDGLSIAWALVEYLHEVPGVAARTLFATHYHELNEMADRFSRIRNYRVQVHEHDGKIIFLRRMVAGGADHSYGIQVARMAGLPDAVISRAREILHHLESQQFDVHRAPDPVLDDEPSGDGAPPVRSRRASAPPSGTVQMSLFHPRDEVAESVKAALEATDPNTLSPIEALLRLAELKAMLQGGGKT